MIITTVQTLSSQTRPPSDKPRISAVIGLLKSVINAGTTVGLLASGLRVVVFDTPLLCLNNGESRGCQ